jgi:hypothetical protein
MNADRAASTAAVPGKDEPPPPERAAASTRRGGARRRYGLLGFPFSRLPSEDRSYSSLDNVTWSIARALDRRGDGVVVGAWDIQPGETHGIDISASTDAPTT